MALPRAPGDASPGSQRSQHILAVTPGGLAPHTPSPPFTPQARDCKSVGDLEGARRHGGRAKVANIICSVVVGVIWVIFIIIVAIFFSTVRAT